MKSKADVLIVENGMTVGKEFVGSFRYDVINAYNIKTNEGIRFFNEMKQRNIINDKGEVHIFPAVIANADITARVNFEDDVSEDKQYQIFVLMTKVLR